MRVFVVLMLCAMPMPEQMNQTCMRGISFLRCTDGGCCCHAQGSFCQTPMEQAALAFLPSAKTAEDVRETVTGSHSWLACMALNHTGVTSDVT